MNCHEKTTRSLSSSLPNRSTMDEQQDVIDQLRNYTIYSDNIKNPPRMMTTDDGSGTATHPKNIINNRRRSESYAVYAASSPQNSLDDSAFIHQFTGEESEFFSSDTLQNQLYPSSLNVDKKIVLYKTEMCRTFEETGTCKYGIKCQFAHDPVEVRNIPRHPRYKTEICKTFWQLGNCPYGKRCCFIHTENELKDSQKPTNSVTGNLSVSRSSVDLYGSDDLTIAEDSSILGEIQSQNSSRSASPSKAAEDLKKSISNLGKNSIFNNLSISNLTNLVLSKSITERRRKSIVNDGKIEDLALLIGSNCSLECREDGEGSGDEDKEAPSSEDPEFKASRPTNFELWSSESPHPTSPTMKAVESNNLNFNKFALFDKSPGSRNSSGIWTSANHPTNALPSSSFIPSSQFYETERDAKIDSLITSIPSGTSSSKSTGSNHQQILIDMLNLLDSSN